MPWQTIIIGWGSTSDSQFPVMPNNLQVFLLVAFCIFRCASISWFQAVSGSVIYRFQLAHLRVFQIIWDIPHNVCLIDLCLMVEPDHQHHPVTVRAHQLVHNLEQWFTLIQKLSLSNSSNLTVPLTNVSSQPPGIGSGPPDSGLKVFFRQSFIWDVSSHLLSA